MVPARLQVRPVRRPDLHRGRQVQSRLEPFVGNGVDRPSVKSLFTPNTRFIEVIEEGFAGGNVISEQTLAPDVVRSLKADSTKRLIMVVTVQKSYWMLPRGA